MRFFKLTAGDIHFQMRYGFYFLYAVFTFFYICVLWAVPADNRKALVTMLIFSDPAAMGLFFMGAIVLLEKSQRVDCALAVSPIKIWEYIGAKVLSLAAIGTAVGAVLALFADVHNLLLTLIGVVLSSVLFSLCGLILAMKTDTLNQFVLATIPFEILIFAPPVLLQFNVKTSLFAFHPGFAAFQLIYGDTNWLALHIASLVLWSSFAFYLCRAAVKKSFAQMGGGKL